MSWENIIGILAVITGAILGYLASYLNNRQQRKWQLDSEYRQWRREEIDKDMSKMFDFIERYVSLAHAYVEYSNSPNDPLLNDLLNYTIATVTEQMRQERSFPVSLKSGPTKRILDELDTVTDSVVEIAINEVKAETEDMGVHLETLRELETSLYSERQKMIEATFN